MGPPKKAKAKASASGSAKKKAKKPTNKETEPMTVDGEQAGPSTPAVWRPGLDEVGEDEELQYDPSTYDCMHHMSLDWPCLSFDILQDGLGGPRSTFPHTITMVAGTQAASSRQNSLALMKLSNLGQGKHGDKAAKEDDSDDDMSDSDDDEEGNPVMHLRQVALSCGVNRVRAMPQQPGVIAAWGDNGQVSIWDMGMQVNEVTAAEDERSQRGRPQRQEPRHVHRHSAEGFALDWSRAAAGRLASGDCRRGIHVWDANEKGNWSVSGRYQGHEDSVEDIQWSPVEGTVFASCSVDKTIRIWDTRGKAVPQLSVVAHATDVNVISWSAQSTFMLASGGDDGALRVWDLRMFGRDAAANESSYVANFTYHRGPVTSVEWCPAEPTMLATSSADGQLAVWDLAVERDPEEEAALAASMNAASPEDLPAQLLFVHLSQGEIKEANWHPQIPGLLVATAADGFTIFKPSNVP